MGFRLSGLRTSHRSLLDIEDYERNPLVWIVIVILMLVPAEEIADATGEQDRSYHRRE